MTIRAAGMRQLRSRFLRMNLKKESRFRLKFVQVRNQHHLNKLQKKTGMILSSRTPASYSRMGPSSAMSDTTIRKPSFRPVTALGRMNGMNSVLRFRKPSLHRLRVNGIHAPGTKGKTSLKRRMAKKGSSAG